MLQKGGIWLCALVWLAFLCVDARATGKEDYEIDVRLGLIDRPWRIDHTRVHRARDLTRGIREGFPPYTQQPMNAQRIVPAPQPPYPQYPYPQYP